MQHWSDPHGTADQPPMLTPDEVDALHAERNAGLTRQNADYALDDEDDLGTCPYYARFEGLTSLPTYDAEGVCYQMGVCSAAGEPECVTCVPRGGWPSVHRMLAESAHNDGSGVQHTSTCGGGPHHPGECAP